MLTLRNNTRQKKAFATISRLAIAAGIIAYLIHKVDISAASVIIAESLHHHTSIILGILFATACFVIGAIRWKIILNFHDLRMSWSRMFAIFSIGLFFNTFMFGATGGDIARGLYTAKETHHKKAEALATIIIDRLIGLTIMLLTAGIMLIARNNFYRKQWQTHFPALIIVFQISAVLLGIAILLNIHRIKNWAVLKPIKNHTKLGPLIQRFLTAILLIRKQGKILLLLSALSATAIIFATLEWYCLGKSFQIEISLLDYLTVIPVITCIAAIPITPGGLGIREGLAVTMFGAMEVSNAQALPLALLVYFISVAYSLLGGLVFTNYSASSGHTIHEEILELRREASGDNGNSRIARTHK